MEVISGLAPFRGITDLNVNSNLQYDKYNTSTSLWETFVSDHAEDCTSYAIDWYVNLNNYDARVFFSSEGVIKFYVEGSNTYTNGNNTYYEGITPYVDLRLGECGVCNTNYYTSDNSNYRYSMRFEDIKDSRVTVRYDCSTKLTSSPFFIEVTVYKDGTVLVNQSSSTPMHKIKFYNYLLLGYTISPTIAVAGRQSRVLVPSITGTDIGWDSLYFKTNESFTLSELLYTPTYNVSMCQIDSISGNYVIPKYYSLKNFDESVDSDKKKLFVGNINGNNKFLLGDPDISEENKALKFCYGNKVYTIIDNNNGSTEHIYDVTQVEGFKTYDRLYTASNYWWNNWRVYGTESGWSIQKIIVGYKMDTSTEDNDYSNYLPQYGDESLYLFYRTGSPATTSTYAGVGYSNWHKVTLGSIPFTNNCRHGHSGSFVYNFNSPVTIYEIAVAPRSPGSGYYGTYSMFGNIILLTNNI